MVVSHNTGEGDHAANERIAPVISLASVRDRRSLREFSDRELVDADDGTQIGHSSDTKADSTSSRAERRAENISLYALTRRGQSRAELAELLTRRGLAAEVVDAELGRLESVGLVDDEALARTLVDRLRERKKLGMSAVRAELQRRRISPDAIEAALADVRDDADDEDLVDLLVQERVHRLRGLDRLTAERRLIGYLARKGHSGNVARAAVRRALDAQHSGAVPTFGGPVPRGRPVEFE